MKEFNELAKLVKELGYKGIWAYMLEIATEIDGTRGLSAEQKQEAYDLAAGEFENYDDTTIGANIFAGAAIKTILDERYSNSEASPHDILMEKLSEELN